MTSNRFHILMTKLVVKYMYMINTILTLHLVLRYGWSVAAWRTNIEGLNLLIKYNVVKHPIKRWLFVAFPPDCSEIVKEIAFHVTKNSLCTTFEEMNAYDRYKEYSKVNTKEHKFYVNIYDLPTTFSSIVNNLSTKQSTICEHASRTCLAPAVSWSESSSFLINWNYT